MSPPAAARRLRVSRKSAYVWHKAWRTERAEALVSKGPGGAALPAERRRWRAWRPCSPFVFSLEPRCHGLAGSQK
ncbi:helix-turn-helix domain-containing protein [Nonomuraea sp. KM90]|uniref:helix-turn-helix domain-containing protein n=1 Tax=Nonomuraea sp. KM90 TaxID=3457428 RepID=UPI003FCD1653